MLLEIVSSISALGVDGHFDRYGTNFLRRLNKNIGNMGDRVLWIHRLLVWFEEIAISYLGPENAIFALVQQKHMQRDYLGRSMLADQDRFRECSDEAAIVF